MTRHFDQAQMELPLWDEGNRDYSTVRWCGANRFTIENNPLCYMINSFQWAHTPEPTGYWSNMLHKLETMEAEGTASYDELARNYGMGETLVAAFNFSYTPDGHEYWYDGVQRLRCIDAAFAQIAMLKNRS